MSSSSGSVRRRLAKAGAALAVLISGCVVAGVTPAGVAHATGTPIDPVHQVSGCANFVSASQLTVVSSVPGLIHFTGLPDHSATVTFTAGSSLDFSSPNDPVLYVQTNVGYIENYSTFTTAFATPQTQGSIDLSNLPNGVVLQTGLPNNLLDFGFCFASAAVTTSPSSGALQLGQVPQSFGTSQSFTLTVQNFLPTSTPVSFGIDPATNGDFFWEFTRSVCTIASGAQVPAPAPFDVDAYVNSVSGQVEFPQMSIPIPASATCRFTGDILANSTAPSGPSEARLIVTPPQLTVTPIDSTAVVPAVGRTVVADFTVGGQGVVVGLPTFTPALPTAHVGGTTPVSWAIDGFDLQNNFAPFGPVDCIPASGSNFAVGDTTVTCSATAADGRSNRRSFTVHVDPQVVADPPQIISAVPTPGVTGSVDVTFAAPVYDGSSAVTQYFISVVNGGVDYGDTLFTPDAGDPGPYTVTLDGTIGGGTSNQTFTGPLPLGTPLTPTAESINADGSSDPATGTPVTLDPPGTSGGQRVTGTDPTVSSTSANGVSTAVSASGSGTVSTSQYSGGLPADVVSPPFGFVKGGGLPTSPFDVLVSRGNGFTTLTLTSCTVPVGTTLWWYQPISASWLPVAADSVSWNVATQCLTEQLSSTSSPSIADLTGTIFALAAAPDATTSTVVATPTSVAAGDTSTVTVTVLDADGQPVPEAFVNLTPSSSASPQELTADNNGVATFTVSDSAGVVTYSATANDVPIGSATVEYTAVVTGTAPTVSATPSTAEVGILSSTTVSVTGDPAPSVTLVGAPAWLSLSGTTLSGTPPAAGNYSFSIQATNAAGTVSTPVTLVVASAPSIATATIPTATSGQSYSAPLAASGGVGGLTWSATGLPAGFSIDHTSGAISGSPTSAGSSPVTVSVVDGLGGTASASYTLTVVAGAPAHGSVTVPSALQLVGASVPVTVAVTDASGNVVPGITVTLTSVAGSATATTDSNGVASFAVKGTAPGSVTYSASAGSVALGAGQIGYGTAPTVSATTSATEVGVATSVTINATGSPAPTIGFTGLPGWLTYDPVAGTLSGTPTAAGPVAFTVTASNSLGHVSTQVNLSVSAALLVTTASLPQGTVGSAYSFTPVTSGGVGAVHWSATGLPSPLVINATTGAITGTPASSSSSSVTITATDSLGATSLVTLSLLVVSAPPPPPGGADLAIGLTAGRVSSGESVELRVKVTNTGTTATSGLIAVADDLPLGTTFRGASGSGWFCAAAGQHVVCLSPSSLGAGRSTSFTITVRVSLRAGSVFTDTAIVAGSFADPTPADDRATFSAIVQRG